MWDIPGLPGSLWYIHRVLIHGTWEGCSRREGGKIGALDKRLEDTMRCLWDGRRVYKTKNGVFSCCSVPLPQHGLQHARLPYPSPTPRACSNWCPSSRWCHPTISSSVVPFSSYLQSFPASGSFSMSQLFTSGGWNIGASASASVLPVNIQCLYPFGLTGLISLQSKGLSRVFSNTTVQKHQFFG